MTPAAGPPPAKLTVTHWLILVIAAIGFAFDIYELLMLPLVAKDAIPDLTGAAPGSPEFERYRGLLFFVPAFAGGLFGLLGGYLTDLLGRRRVLTGSILLYATSAFLAGYSTTFPMLLTLRCLTFIGVCVEFVAAVAWLAELFPNPIQREKVLGYSQAFSSVGGLLVAVVYSYILDLAPTLPAVGLPDWLNLGAVDKPHAAWRYTLMSGLIPAIPLIVIRPFLPESPAWQRKRQEGTLKRPSILALFSPELRRTTIVTTLLFACAYGVAFGAIQNINEIVPGLADVKAKATAAADDAKAAGKPPVPAAKAVTSKAGSDYVKVQEIGGLVGRFVLAVLAVRIVSRRGLLRVFQIPALIVVPLVFYFFLQVPNEGFGYVPLGRVGNLPITTMSLGVFVAGLLTVAQFSFWGNYLPRVYPVHLRGTGESFAANIGGRMIGTSFAWVSGALAVALAGADTANAAYHKSVASAIVALALTAVGVVASFWLPEPGPEEPH